MERFNDDLSTLIERIGSNQPQVVLGRLEKVRSKLVELKQRNMVGNSDLASGVYHYVCKGHSLEIVKEGDHRKQLRQASLDQEPVENCALDIVIAAIYHRTTVKYGDRGRDRYVPMEAGHVAENICLQAQSLGLGTVTIGAFYDDHVREVIAAPAECVPLYVMPVGRTVQ